MKYITIVIEGTEILVQCLNHGGSYWGSLIITILIWPWSWIIWPLLNWLNILIMNNNMSMMEDQIDMTIIIIDCSHGLWNTFVTIDALIINLIYGIVTIRLSLICWRLIWSCPVDLVFLSFSIVRDAACTGWGLRNEDFLVIRGCVLSCLASTSDPIVWCLCLTSVYVFSPAVEKKLLKVLALIVRYWKLHLFYFDFPGPSCLSRCQVSLGFVLAFLSASW